MENRQWNVPDNNSLWNNVFGHWNRNVVILTKFSSLAAPEVVILTTSVAASDENFIKLTNISVSLGVLALSNATKLMPLKVIRAVRVSLPITR